MTASVTNLFTKSFIMCYIRSAKLWQEQSKVLQKGNLIKNLTWSPYNEGAATWKFINFFKLTWKNQNVFLLQSLKEYSDFWIRNFTRKLLLLNGINRILESKMQVIFDNKKEVFLNCYNLQAINSLQIFTMLGKQIKSPFLRLY